MRAKKFCTIKGVINTMLGGMRRRTRLFKYDDISFTKKEFVSWLLKNNFKNLFINWKKSNYNKKLIPSVDRIDNDGFYTFNNMQLMTWEDNRLKQAKLVSKKVAKISKTGIIINTYDSIAEAARLNNTHTSNISRCCLGKRKYHQKCIWKYLE